MKNEEYPVNRLSRREFTDALQKGLGRARLYAIRYGIDEVADIVLKACLHDQANDPQSEHSKAKYLFAIFQNTKYLSGFKEAILSSLKTKRNTWDVQLLFELALKMAMAGDFDSRIAIRDKALRKAKKRSVDDWLGAQELITIYGKEGAIELAKTYGSRLLKNPEDFVPEDEIFPNEEIKNEFHNILLNNSRNLPELKAYRNYLESRRAKPRTGLSSGTETISQRRKQEIRKYYNLDSILNYARNKIDKYGSRFVQFGSVATPEELKVVYKNLLNETDVDIIWRLLNVFSKVPLPDLNGKLFIWAHAQDFHIRESAIQALSQNRDNKVHSLARKKVQTSKLVGADSGSIELFVNNYKHDDAKLITDALYRTTPTKEDAHRLAWDIIDLSKKYQDPSLGEALKWSYEKTPCSACRYRIVKQLDLLGQLDNKILYECQFDSNEEILALAWKKLVSTNP